jgi:hypothetical protein
MTEQTTKAVLGDLQVAPLTVGHGQQVDVGIVGNSREDWMGRALYEEREKLAFEERLAALLEATGRWRVVRSPVAVPASDVAVDHGGDPT